MTPEGFDLFEHAEKLDGLATLAEALALAQNLRVLAETGDDDAEAERVARPVVDAAHALALSLPVLLAHRSGRLADEVRAEHIRRIGEARAAVDQAFAGRDDNP